MFEGQVDSIGRYRRRRRAAVQACFNTIHQERNIAKSPGQVKLALCNASYWGRRTIDCFVRPMSRYYYVRNNVVVDGIRLGFLKEWHTMGDKKEKRAD